jgi:hypothetical protein
MSWQRAAANTKPLFRRRDSGRLPNPFADWQDRRWRCFRPVEPHDKINWAVWSGQPVGFFIGRKAVVRRADESLLEIAVVPEGEGAGLSARIVDHAAARPPRSRAQLRHQRTNLINTEDNKKSFANVSEVTGNSRIKMEGVCKTRREISTA